MTLPLAHETWFEAGHRELDWSFAGETLTLALLACAVLVTLAVRLLARVVPGVDIPFLARMAPWMPFAVRLHLAVSLIGLLSLGVYLSPAMDLEADLAGILLGINMAVVAIGMATGWHTREAAWLLIALGPLGMIEFGVSPVLQRLDVLGLAVFVLCTGPGRWSADMELGRRARAEPRRPGPRRVGAARGRRGRADRRRVRREAREPGARARVPPGASRAQCRARSSGWAGATCSSSAWRARSRCCSACC